MVLPAMGTRCSESRRMIIAWLCLHLPPVPERKGDDPGQSCGVPSDPGRDIPAGPCGELMWYVSVVCVCTCILMMPENSRNR